MLNYIDTQNALRTRMVEFDINEYLFVLQVVMGEDVRVAYASVYDKAEFKRNVPSEDEEEYLNKWQRDANILLQHQNCEQLKEYLEQEYQSTVQEQASTLEDYRFTGADVQRLLNNLLHDRTQELSESSVRDILALIKSMYESGALDSGDSFTKHFITVPNKYNALCPSCNRELYAVEGLDIKCVHCGQVFKWVEEENRFYPRIGKL